MNNSNVKSSNSQATNGTMRTMRSPPPSFRPPPPFMPPPNVPASPLVQRKLSVNAPFKSASPVPSSTSSTNSTTKRPIERIEDQRISKFGEPGRLKSPTPNSFRPSNGSNGDLEVDFLDLLEKEEENFADQIKKQKVFLQSVFKDKEDLAKICHGQQLKLQRLESERQEWQKKIIEAEREKRDFLERLEQEQQSGRQAMKKSEKQKRELEKLQSDFALAAKERNEAVSRLSKELKEVTTLEEERKKLFARIDSLERQKLEQIKGNATNDLSKNMADANMKLKLEMGSVKAENDKLSRDKAEIERQLAEVEAKLKNSENDCNDKRANDELLKKQLDVKFLKTDSNLGKIKSELSMTTDALSKMKKEFDLVDAEKKRNLEKMKEMQKKLEECDADKQKEVKGMQKALEEATKANHILQENLEKQKLLLADIERDKKNFAEGQSATLKRDKEKAETDLKNLQNLLDKRKQVEAELEMMVKDLKEKLDKFESDKRSSYANEKKQRDAFSSKIEQEKKDLDDRLQKMKSQFEKAAIESKKEIAKLNQEVEWSKNITQDVKDNLAKKEDEVRNMNNKLSAAERELNRYKALLKTEGERRQEEFEQVESKLNESRRSCEALKKKVEILEKKIASVTVEKDAMLKKIEEQETELKKLRNSGSQNLEKSESLKSKFERELRDSESNLSRMKEEKSRLQSDYESKFKELSSDCQRLQKELQATSSSRDELSKKITDLVSNKDNQLAEQLRSKDALIQDKEKEKNEIRSQLEAKCRKFQTESENINKQHKVQVDKLLNEISESSGRLGKKEEVIAKLEKDKREIALNRDKVQKQLEELETEKEILKDNLTRLEQEKKSNNFGKYEKEKMKSEIDKLIEEKTKLNTKIENLSSEKNALETRLEETTKLEWKGKEELNKRNEILERNVYEMKTKLAETESVKKDLANALSLAKNESGNLDRRCVDLEKARSELQLKNGMLTSEINKLEKKCKELQEVSGKSEQSQSAEINSLQKDKDKLQVTLSDLEKKQTLIVKELDGLKKELRTSEEAKSQLSTKLQKLKGEEDNKAKPLQQKVEELQKERISLEKRIKTLDTEKMELGDKIKPLEKEKVNLSQKIKELEDTKAELSKKNRDLENSLTSKQKEQEKKFQAELKDLQKESQSLRKEKDEVCKAIKVIEKDLRKVVRESNQKKMLALIKKLVEGIEMNTLVPKSEEELSALKDLDQLAQELSDKASEADTLKENFEKLQNDFSDRTNELEVFNSQLQKAKSDSSMAVEKLKKSEEDLAHIKEKNAQLSDELLSKSRQLTALENQTKDNKASDSKRGEELKKTIEELQSKLDHAYEQKKAPMERKKSVKFSLDVDNVIGNEVTVAEKEEKIKELEKALEDAARERQEILEAAESEIEYHRSIACDLEQTMIEDFEWKIHEIEADFHRKLKDAQDPSTVASTSGTSRVSSGGKAVSEFEFEKRLQTEKNKWMRQKDEELAKLNSQMRREMDEKLRAERNSMKESYGTSSRSSESLAVQRLEREKQSVENRLASLELQLKANEDKLVKAVNEARREGDQKVFDERKKSSLLAEQSQEEMESLREELTGKISRLRAEYDEKVEDLETRLENALGAKLEHMMALREEVEQEYADNMEALRNMYRNEMDNQTEKFEAERIKMNKIENSLKESLITKRNEYDELRCKSLEFEEKVAELTTRLENQTLEVLRLQTELEEYEYEDAVTNNNW